MDLHQRVDQLLGDPPALGRRVERGRQREHDRLALHALHHVERASDRGGVVLHREHGGHARGGVLQRAQQPRLAQHVVGGGRQRRARGAAQHQLAAVGAADQVGDVGVPLADRARLQLALAEAVGVEELAQRLQHQQRRAGVLARLRVGLDDVIRRDC